LGADTLELVLFTAGGRRYAIPAGAVLAVMAGSQELPADLPRLDLRPAGGEGAPAPVYLVLRGPRQPACGLAVEEVVEVRRLPLSRLYRLPWPLPVAAPGLGVFGVYLAGEQAVPVYDPESLCKAARRRRRSKRQAHEPSV